MSGTNFNDSTSKKKEFFSRIFSRKSKTTHAAQISAPSTNHSSPWTQNGPFGRWKEFPKDVALEEEIGQMPEWPSDPWDEPPVAGWGQMLGGQGKIDWNGAETGGDQTWVYDV
jgi:hypothetical protein